jgi:ubiquinone/menaquinone biosynthesis C-methylase UbiE
MHRLTSGVPRHRHRPVPRLAQVIFDELCAAGRDPRRVSVDDLVYFDQLHAGGRAFTDRLALRARLAPGLRVLDIGGGLGGPARVIASVYGCSVFVIDRDAEFCRSGAVLTERAGLAERVSFIRGDALMLPFGDAEFDVVWMQQTGMTIEDKRRLYGEAHRVVRSGGKLVLQEITAGSAQAGPALFPILWADSAASSFLPTAPDLRGVCREAGFRELFWVDVSNALGADIERLEGSPISLDVPPPASQRAVVGDNAALKVADFVRSLREGRIRVVHAMLQRGAAVRT